MKRLTRNCQNFWSHTNFTEIDAGFFSKCTEKVSGETAQPPGSSTDSVDCRRMQDPDGGKGPLSRRLSMNSLNFTEQFLFSGFKVTDQVGSKSLPSPSQFSLSRQSLN